MTKRITDEEVKEAANDMFKRLQPTAVVLKWQEVGYIFDSCHTL